MKENNELFVWGDNWWIENEEAWFVWGMKNILCYVNMNSGKGKFFKLIPDMSKSLFRLTPYCIKYNDDIYCMPVYGKSIWIYNINCCRFDEICINGSNSILLNIRDFWKFDNKIYMVSNGLGQILEIDPSVKKIENCYCIHNVGEITKSVKVGVSIFSLFGESGDIYQFDLVKKEVFLYKLPDIRRKFSTFCFDGKNFWLSGFRKEIYVWDKEENKVTILDNFPKEFGIYDFSKETDGVANCIIDEYEKSTFAYSTVVEEKVWFIPYCTNKILYVNKCTYQLYVFEIDEERETKESILERSSLGYKYLLNYVKDNRYIGLFSIKNQSVLEIDSVELKVNGG